MRVDGYKTRNEMHIEIERLQQEISTLREDRKKLLEEYELSSLQVESLLNENLELKEMLDNVNNP